MMKTYDALPANLQTVAKAMSDAARQVLRDAGIARAIPTLPVV